MSEDSEMQHDWHVKEWRMLRAQSFLVWDLLGRTFRDAMRVIPS